jgi:quinoprotein glucose dehydrogenase
VSEEKVPTESDIPGAQPWPTQPIPAKPAQLTRSGFALNEVNTVTPEAHDFCQACVDREHLQPSVRYQPLVTGGFIVNFPAAQGGRSGQAALSIPAAACSSSIPTTLVM